MKYSAAFAVASAVAVKATTGCTEEGGNFYCKAVKALQYDGLDIAGSYKSVTSMDGSGNCAFEDTPYSGAIAPFDEGISVHLRGPVELKNFAVYTPKTTTKRDVHKHHSKRHGHQHLHKKAHEHKQEERAVGDLVTAVIDGKLVSWTNEYSGLATPAPAVAAAAASPVVAAAAAVSSGYATSSKASSAKTDTSSVAVGNYERIAYYNAENETAYGLTFLGNYGGQGSGVWDKVYGSSLAYLNEDASAGSASPTVLKNVLVPDNVEFAIYSDVSCEKAGTCGFSRPGSVAYEGFTGANKVLVFEIKMPMSGKTGFNADMSALWTLNGKIARTQQYGNCSCWGGIGAGGCGEFDILEVLSTGDTKCKSTFHYTNSIGNSDYIQRPVDSYMKVAVVFQASSATASIKVLDDSFDFATGLTTEDVDDMVSAKSNPGLFSLMSIPSK